MCRYYKLVVGKHLFGLDYHGVSLNGDGDFICDAKFSCVYQGSNKIGKKKRVICLTEGRTDPEYIMDFLMEQNGNAEDRKRRKKFKRMCKPKRHIPKLTVNKFNINYTAALEELASEDWSN